MQAIIVSHIGANSSRGGRYVAKAASARGRFSVQDNDPTITRKTVEALADAAALGLCRKLDWLDLPLVRGGLNGRGDFVYVLQAPECTLYPSKKAEPDSVLIDPKEFTDSEWSDLFYACELIPRATIARRSADNRHDADAFNASRADVVEAINSCNAKADSVRAGELGDSEEAEDLDIEEWADQLEQIAIRLADLLGSCSCSGRAWEAVHYADCDLAGVTR